MGKSSFSENIRASRIRTLLKREGKTQEELAGMIYVNSKKTGELVPMEPQNLSRRLASENVSESLCRKIVEIFPAYRIEWLLGYDDYMTLADQFSEITTGARSESEVMTNALLGLARLSGFTVEPTEPQPDRSVQSIINAIKKGITFSRDGRSVSMSLAELNDFENELCDYVEMRLNRMMK